MSYKQEKTQNIVGPSALAASKDDTAPRASLFTLRATMQRARRTCTFPGVLASLIAFTVFVMSRDGLSDPDIWWHLRNAEYLLTNHRLPRFDVFSFTVIGHPWVNHEWLAEIPYYLALRTFGLVGIKVVSVVVLESIFLGLLHLCWRVTGNIKASAAVCIFAVTLGAVSFGPRTLLFGYLYLLVLLTVLESFHSRGRAPLFVLPPLFCLWINTHGSWSLGMVIFVIFIAAGLIQGTWGRLEARRWSTSQVRMLSTTMIASVGALFVNPYGYRLVFYPFDLAFHQRLNIAHVAEWLSVDFHEVRGKLAMIVLVVLLLASLLSNYRWRLYELGWILFGLYCGLTYIRFLFLLAILAAPLLTRFLDFIPPYQPEVDKPLVNLTIITAILAFVIGSFPTTALLQQSIDKDYPTEAVVHFKAHPPTGRVLNFYLWGGFLEWNNREMLTFVDSRVDVFEHAGVFKDYIDLLGLKDPEAVFDKYHIQYVFFPQNEPLSYVLRHDSRWKKIYSDNLAEMFERSDSVVPIGTFRAEGLGGR